MDVSIIGILTMKEESDGSQTFALVSPEHMYTVLLPEETPRNWIPVAAALAREPGITIIGPVLDAGEMK